MHPKVQKYIDRIKSNDQELRYITLDSCGVCNEDIVPLLEELATVQNFTVARISIKDNNLTSISIPSSLAGATELFLHFNKLRHLNIVGAIPNLVHLQLANNLLRTINILGTLPNLYFMDVSNNQLTIITKIMLRQFNINQRINRDVAYDEGAGFSEFTEDKITHEALNIHFEAIIIDDSLIPNGDDLDITTILNELKKIKLCNNEETLQVSISAVRQAFPGNQIVTDYLASDAIGKIKCKLKNMFDQNLETLKYNVKNDHGLLPEIIDHLKNDQKFSFIIAQKLLHDVYLELPSKEESLNNPTIKLLVYWTLSIQDVNPDFELDVQLRHLMYGNERFLQENTALMEIVKDIKNNSFQTLKRLKPGH